MIKKSRKIKKQSLIILVAVLIAFLILAGWMMFKQLTEEKKEQANKTYCTAEQKNAQICPQYYSATCGWFDQSIKCLVYPCAQTFSNSCSACADSKVEFYTAGECPK